MPRQKMNNEIIDNYKKKIKINTFFNENGQDLQNIMQEIIVNNCNPLQRKNLEI